eukprot:gene12821-9166_t
MSAPRKLVYMRVSQLVTTVYFGKDASGALWRPTPRVRWRPASVEIHAL